MLEIDFVVFIFQTCQTKSKCEIILRYKYKCIAVTVLNMTDKIQASLSNRY